MKIVKSDQLKIKILKELAKAKSELSYYAIMKRLKMNEIAFFPNCQFLECLELVAVRNLQIPNGRTYHYAAITQKGLAFLDKITSLKPSA